MRPADPADLRATARLHRRALPGGFFARLGERFVRRYHATFAGSPEAVLLVAEQEGRTAGFLAGTLANRRHYREVVRRWWPALTWAGALALLRRPRVTAEFLRTRLGRYRRALLRAGRGGRTAGATAEPDGPVAVLTHVAVAPDARGDGVGQRLVQAFVERARRAGAAEIRLVTAAGGAAARFYRRLGWRSRGTRRGADGTFVEEFELQL